MRVPSPPKPGRAKSRWSKKKVLFVLWLLGLLIVPWIAKSILLGRLNERLSEAARKASRDKIVQVEVDFSILRLWDFLRLGGHLVRSLGSGTRPALGEIRLSGAQIHLTPVDTGQWKLRLVLNQISGSVVREAPLVTRTEILGSTLILARGTPEEILLHPFEFRLAPSTAQPASHLEYSLRGESETLQLDIRGTYGPTPSGERQHLLEGHVRELPLPLLPYFISDLRSVVQSGSLTTEGTAVYSSSLMQFDLRYSATDLGISTSQVSDPSLRRALERLNQQRNVPPRPLRLSVPLNQTTARWDTLLAEALTRG